ncbi:hypothetical protein [Streptomyces lavendofoliae]|uniref:hypothetical protein n=1 Tax=Streptomyces lavendofoliae TaxID=67314 RepID=UPI00300F4AE0
MNTQAGRNRDPDAAAWAALDRPIAMRRETHGRIRTHRPAVADRVAGNGTVEENIVRGED